nr:putative reverse transcriptase domain-containing protein [Tanacetum cinerariifolium]
VEEEADRDEDITYPPCGHVSGTDKKDRRRGRDLMKKKRNTGSNTARANFNMQPARLPFDGGGNGLTKTSLITHLRDRHCNGDAQAITRQSLSTNLAVFEEAEGSDFVSPPDCGDCVVRFVLYDLTKPHVPSSSEQLDYIDYLVMRETLAESSPPLSDVDEEDINLGERNIKQCKRKIMMTKHPFKPPPSLPHISIDHLHLVASPAVVLNRIKSFPRGTSCGRDGLRAQHLMDCLSGANVAIFDELVSSITKWVAGGSEAIIHFVNRLIEAYEDDIGLSMLLVDFKNAFNLLDREVMLREVRLRCLAISNWVESVGLIHQCVKGELEQRLPTIVMAYKTRQELKGLQKDDMIRAMEMNSTALELHHQAMKGFDFYKSL